MPELQITDNEAALIQKLRKTDVGSVEEFDDYCKVLSRRSANIAIDDFEEALEEEGLISYEGQDSDTEPEDEGEAQGEEVEDEGQDTGQYEDSAPHDDDYDEDDYDEDDYDDLISENRDLKRQLKARDREFMKRISNLEKGQETANINYTKDQFREKALDFIKKNPQDYRRVANMLRNPDSDMGKHVIETLFRLKEGVEKDTKKPVLFSNLFENQEESLKVMEHEMRGEDYTPRRPKMRILNKEEGSEEQFKSEQKEVTIDGTEARVNKNTDDGQEKFDFSTEDGVQRALDMTVKQAIGE